MDYTHTLTSLMSDEYITYNILQDIYQGENWPSKNMEFKDLDVTEDKTGPHKPSNLPRQRS